MIFKDYSDLRKKLPRGYAKKVAEEFCVTKSLVYKIARGERKGAAIFLRLLKLAEENENMKKEIKKKFKYGK